MGLWMSKKKDIEAYVLRKLAYTWHVRVRGEHTLVFGGVCTYLCMYVKHGVFNKACFKKGAKTIGKLIHGSKRDLHPKGKTDRNAMYRMWQGRRRWKMDQKFCLETWCEEEHLDDLRIDKMGSKVIWCDKLGWFRLDQDNNLWLLWLRLWTFRLYKRTVILDKPGKHKDIQE